MLVDELAANARRYGDDAVRSAREQPLDAGEDARFRRTEISLVHVPVIGVDEARALVRANDSVVGERRDAAHGAGFRHMRMHDVGTEAAQQRKECRRGADVVDWRNRTPQERYVPHGEPIRPAALEQVPHVAFAGIRRSVHEQRVVSPIGQTRRQLNRLDRRTADVQPCDDAQNAHARHCNT